MKKDIYYSKGTLTIPYLLLTVGFVVCLIVANLTEIKTVDIAGLKITAGVIVFPISYIINDCVVEVYGFAKARLMIWVGFAMALAAALLLQLAIWLPGGEEWTHQQAMQDIYGAAPRIMVASFTAFLAGSMINAYVMSRMKEGAARGGFRFRAIVSTIWGEGTDSAIFFPIAFAGILPWSTILALIISQTMLKTLYEILILPMTVRFVTILQRKERNSVSLATISVKNER